MADYGIEQDAKNVKSLFESGRARDEPGTVKARCTTLRSSCNNFIDSTIVIDPEKAKVNKPRDLETAYERLIKKAATYTTTLGESAKQELAIAALQYRDWYRGEYGSPPPPPATGTAQDPAAPGPSGTQPPTGGSASTTDQ